MAHQQLESWALPRLQQLLPIDAQGLRQIIQYTDTLPKAVAAEHLKNLLGDDAKSLEFISSFNLRRPAAPAETSRASTTTMTTTDDDGNPHTLSSASGAAQTQHRLGGRSGKKKKANIHSLPPRQVEGQGEVSGAYRKREEDDYYIPKNIKPSTREQQVADNLALREKPSDATKLPLITDEASAAAPSKSKPPPSAAGLLVSDSLTPKKASAQNSRTSSPAPKAKVSISGGTAMQGASTTLSDLDRAIRSLEVQTNPSLSLSEADNEKRKCNCMATKHPLLDIAPNCLNCGKIICVKEGLGPCTFCATPLLSVDDITKVLRVLKDERGEERMKAKNAVHKRPDVAHGKARAFTGREFLAHAASSSSSRTSPLSSTPTSTTPVDSEDDEVAVEMAKAHRDKLLAFQANNARRTRVHDEAADYDIPSSGTNMWASPAERAQQLKRQQKVMREMEWAAKPEYEKRRVVASIDVKGGKVVKKMAEVEMPDFSVPDENNVVVTTASAADSSSSVSGNGGGAGASRGNFSDNPLAAGLIRPTAREPKAKGGVRESQSIWRRVQMDEDDNEQWILDGGVYGGHMPHNRILSEEEHAAG